MSRMAFERVLITGIAGHVGANLARACLRNGLEVHGLVRSTTDLWRLQDSSLAVRLHSVDLTCYDSVCRIVEEVAPDVVFHCAAERRQEYPATLMGNVLGTANLLEATRPDSKLRFVHLASSLEYGPSDRPLRETDRLQPTTRYGASKAGGTLLAQQAAHSGQRHVVVLRLFHVYGPWESPHRLVPTAIMAAHTGTELHLTTGDFRRDYIYVDDVVTACLRAAEAERISGEAINIGTGVETSNEELVHHVEGVMGRQIPVNIDAYAPRETDTNHWVADIRKAEQLMGWRPTRSVLAGLTETRNWLEEHEQIYAGGR